MSVVSVGCLSVYGHERSRGRRRGDDLRLLRWLCRLLRGGRRLRRLGLRWRSGRWRSRGAIEAGVAGTGGGATAAGAAPSAAVMASMARRMREL